MIKLFGWVLMRRSMLSEIEGELRYSNDVIKIYKEDNNEFNKEVRGLEAKIVELHANEFSMRMRMEQVEKELNDNQNQENITIENLRVRLKNLEVMNDEYVCAAVKENNKVEELEEEIENYSEVNKMYIDCIDKQDKKIKKLEAKIIKLKESR